MPLSATLRKVSKENNQTSQTIRWVSRRSMEQIGGLAGRHKAPDSGGTGPPRSPFSKGRPGRRHGATSVIAKTRRIAAVRAGAAPSASPRGQQVRLPRRAERAVKADQGRGRKVGDQ